MLQWKWDNIYSGNAGTVLSLAIRVDGSNSVRRHTHDFIEIGCVENGTMRHVVFTKEGKIKQLPQKRRIFFTSLRNLP